MAGTSTKTKPVAARVPVELADWMETQGKAGDVIVRALTALRGGVTGDGPDQRPIVLQTLVQQLEAENARLTTERDQWRDRAKAIVAAKPMPTSNAEARRLATQHPSGPVYEPKLKVGGTTQPMFRAGSEAEKALKSGQK